ncbi:WD40 repeat domain-containing protein [Patescibacteria group bacterium]|nr:WD40 repeat domain-containing protein [Patescibacteria group bacterium]
MNLFWRRFIYLGFFLIFFLAAFGLLFYLQGYRYDFTNNRLERIGALMADSLPLKADLFINDQITPHQTPVTVQSLHPQDYLVKLTRDGFQSWQKKLKVQPALVTFTGQVRLWPNQTDSQPITSGQINNALLSPNKENLLYQIPKGLNSGLWLLNLASGQTALLKRQAGLSFKNLEWSPSSRHFLTQQSNNGQLSWQIYSLSDSAWRSLNLPVDLNPKQLHWGDDEDLVFISTDNELYSFNYKNGSKKLIWREAISDFRVHDNLIFALSLRSNQSLALKALNLSNLQVVLFDDPPTLSSNLKFLPANQPSGWLPLFDLDRHILYLLHSPLTELIPIRRLPEVNSLDWSPDGQSLLLTNNFEIWDYQITDNKLNLLLRLGSAFSLGRYFNQEPYLIVAAGQEIWALETDTRDTQQRWLLSELKNEVQDIYLDPKNKNIILLTEAGLNQLTVDPSSLSDNRQLIRWP